MKYQSELINEILEDRGHEKSSLHYESECVEKWIEETKGAYPKLCDYESEWLNYINEEPLGEFPYETVTDVTDATVNNVVPYEYKSAILKGQTMVNLQSLVSFAYQNTGTGIVVKEDNRIIFISESTGTANIYVNYLADTSKTYTVKCKLFNNSSSDIKFITHVLFGHKPLATVPSGETLNVNFQFQPYGASVENGVFMLIQHVSPRVIGEEVIIEDLVITESMQSVKMPVLTTSNEDGTKTNILTVNEDVTLRGIGEVKDELDCLTGEVTERIGEIVLDGSNGWINTPYSTTDTICYDVNITKKGKIYGQHENVGLISDKLPSRNWVHFYADKTNEEGIVLDGDSGLTIHLKINKNNLSSQDIDGIRAYLKSNPITVQYQLATESVKTVDLSIQDQDGNTLSKIKPIEGTMHIHSNGSPLKPSITMEIPVEATTQNLYSFIEEE